MHVHVQGTLYIQLHYTIYLLTLRNLGWLRPPPQEAPFHPAVFGTTLDDVMEQQQGSRPDLHIPWVVQALCEAVISLQGPSTEGIFRYISNLSTPSARL